MAEWDKRAGVWSKEGKKDDFLVLQRRIYHRKYAEARIKNASLFQGVVAPKNAIAYKRLFKKISSIPEKVMKATMIALYEAQRELMQHAEANIGYQNLTGNTATSTLSALYFGLRAHGKPMNIMGMPTYKGRRPTHKKLPLKSWRNRRRLVKIRLFDTGEKRYFNPNDFVIPTSDGYGKAYAIEQLRKWSMPSSKKDGTRYSGFMLTTGTEYTPFLEKVRHLNVITATKREAKRIVKRHLANVLKDIVRNK